MFGQTIPIFANAELAYRHERILADMHRARRPLQLRWPIGLINPRRRQPRIPRRPMPSPHHATSH